ncbi:hypothetical protein FQN50_004959 [Emmonsiellopsis sp. PD_5]|nr:hypothetical protein FQN50_004959 [Emmonsiellopsis sp. PD_5]
MSPKPPQPGSSHPQPSLKILMLHGYTQSGQLFHAKTRALEKHLQKSFPLHAVHLSYPTGPLPLSPSDIPNFQPSTTTDNPNPTDTTPESFAWWRRSDTTSPPEYLGIDSAFSSIAKLLTDQGPFDGVIGFSQGAAFAAMLASLLEPDRASSFAYFSDPNHNSCPAGGSSSTTSAGEIVTGIPFPPSFKQLTHPPLKFAICYSGFRAPGTRFRAFYERPKIRTPVLHVLGSLDAIVDEERSRTLVEACEGDGVDGEGMEGRVIWHPGGHFLPSQRPYLDGAVRFIKGCLEGGEGGGKEKGVVEEERVEDMDVPF